MGDCIVGSVHTPFLLCKDHIPHPSFHNSKSNIWISIFLTTTESLFHNWFLTQLRSRGAIILFLFLLFIYLFWGDSLELEASVQNHKDSKELGLLETSP